MGAEHPCPEADQQRFKWQSQVPSSKTTVSVLCLALRLSSLHALCLVFATTHRSLMLETETVTVSEILEIHSVLTWVSTSTIPFASLLPWTPPICRSSLFSYSTHYMSVILVPLEKYFNKIWFECMKSKQKYLFTTCDRIAFLTSVTIV